MDYNFKSYEIATFDSKALKATAEQKRNDFINIPFRLSKKYSWDLELTTDKVFADRYISQEGSVSRNKESISLPIVLRGYSENSNNIKATITVNDNFLYGRVDLEGEIIFFEPLSTFDKNAKPDQIVIYRQSDVIERENGTCAAHDLKKKKDKISLTQVKKHNENSRFPTECREVELAIANDHTMYSQYGANVASMNAGVIANVNTDYDDNDFDYEIRFVIVETYIAQNSGQNAWGATSNIGVLLDNFTAWGPSGFNNTHDLGELWSRTDLIYHNQDGSTSASTIGLAWVGTVCSSSYKYHVLEDYGGNASGLRNLVSHEIGHNFNLGHIAASGYIMTGSVSGTTTWNASSISNINSYVSGLNCLSVCEGGGGPGGTPPVANFDASLIQECNPTRVQMNDLSTNSPTSWSWQIQNGSPSTSTQQNPIIDLPGGGTYGVTLTATNEHGSNTKVLNMNLNNIGNPPNAAFTYSVNGNTVTFDNNTTNGLTYSWNFGDGSTSATANPSHTYANPGTYAVTLTSNNDCGTDSEVQNVTITDQVFAGFSANATSICEGESITFSNQSSSNVESYFWEFENGSPSTSTQENPTVTYNFAGTFNAKLTVTGGGTNDVETKVNYVTINDVPNSSFTETIDGYTVEFDNNTLGGFTYNWSFGDGNASAAANPTHTYSTSGTYNVTLTSSNDCGSDMSIRTITIADEVNADFIVDKTTDCQGEEFQFTSISTGNITEYFWQFQNGTPATSTEQNPSVIFSPVGAHTVTLTVSNSLYNDTESKNNFVKTTGAPFVDFEFDVTENTVIFDNNTVGGFFYDWDFGDGQTSTSPNPTHTYAGPGDYTVTLVSDNDCSEDEISKIVSIESDIVARFIVDHTEVCEGGAIQFTNTSEGVITSYFWEFEGGSPATSTAENPQVVFNQAGTYNAKLTVSDGSASDSENKINYITINDEPSASFTSNVSGYEVTFDNNSLNANSYSWNFGDGETSATANPTHSYAAPGSYDVTLTATNNCGSDIDVREITIIEIVEADFDVSVEEICEGESVTLNNNSAGEIASYLWEIEGGSPATSTLENPTITFDNAGDFNVKLTITGDFGAVDTKTLTDIIQVSDSPAADFSYVLNELTVTYSNLSEHFETVSWDFGDGTNSSDQSPTHTYAAEGNYSVTLTVTGLCGNETKVIEVPVFNELLANFTASETTLCPGETLVLNDLSSGNPTEWNWVIEGEEMIYVTEQNPVINLEEPGMYNVELTVKNSEDEDSKIIQQYIEVMPLPEAGFSYVQDEMLITFQNNSQNGKSYSWDFGDGTTSNLPNPTHEFANEGNYNVKLIVENDCSQIETNLDVPVFNKLVAGFNTDVTDICATNNIQFTDQSSGNATSWNWTFPGGTPATSTERNPVVSYENAGTYDVILKVNSETEEIIETRTDFVNVSELPISEFQYEVDKNKVQFFNLSKNGDEFKWSFGSDELSPVFEFDEEKAYEVSLITFNSCSSDTMTQIIDLYNEADTYGNFSISSNSYCLSDEISFIDLSSEDITEWLWEFPGGTPSTSTEKNPKVNYEAFGVYDVKLTVTNGFNTRVVELEDYVTIIEKPTAGFDITQIDNKILVEDLSTFGSHINWTINKKISFDTLTEFTFTKNGTFVVEQEVSNSCGSSITNDTVSITVFPSAGFSLDRAQGCAPLKVSFESRSTENADEVTWLLPGSDQEEISGYTPEVVYETPGNYGIKVIATNSFGSDTLELNSIIEVYAQPEIDVDFIVNNLEVNFNAASERYDSIVWDFGDGSDTQTGENVTHTYDAVGDYMAVATIYLGECYTVFKSEISLLSSGINEVEEIDNFHVFPNPANKHLDLSFDGIENVKQVEIIDQLGQQLLVREIDNQRSSIRINALKNLPAGQYFVALILSDKPAVYRKLIIVH
ncbi:hypothetical protein GCM10007940_07160 [Portibacter lacus]|uniref:PKD domain-containing protein n=1 Tax=Portibacter lacus TaxID=1099794 RepID=A0AA37SN47_9BACT|nr:hypothetical protein GCM10007940_07160 [Portibacter lacus]